MNARRHPICAADVRGLGGIVSVVSAQDRDGPAYFRINHASRGRDLVWLSSKIFDEDHAFTAARMRTVIDDTNRAGRGKVKRVSEESQNEILPTFVDDTAKKQGKATTVDLVIENTKRSATITDIRSFGREDGAYLSDVAAGLMGSIAEKRAVFEPWARSQIAACEIRLQAAGCSPEEIAAWRSGCGGELLRRAEKVVS